MKDFLSKCDQIRKKFLMENFIFYVMQVNQGDFCDGNQAIKLE